MNSSSSAVAFTAPTSPICSLPTWAGRLAASKDRPVALLDQIVSSFGMPVAADGFPIVDKNLHWKDQLYVTGAPRRTGSWSTARNILGARLAGERLKRAFERHPWDFAKTLVASSLHGFASIIR